MKQHLAVATLGISALVASSAFAQSVDGMKSDPVMQKIGPVLAGMATPSAQLRRAAPQVDDHQNKLMRIDDGYVYVDVVANGDTEALEKRPRRHGNAGYGKPWPHGRRPPANFVAG